MPKSNLPTVTLILILGLFQALSLPTTSFTCVGRQINISVHGQGTPEPQIFKIRGFSYSNSRIGEGASTDDGAWGFDSLQRPLICKQDFDFMRKLNVNALKLYAFNVLNNPQNLHQQCLDLAWNNGSKPIFIIPSIWITTLPFPNQQARQFMEQNYAKMVTQTRDHPAVMGYSIGSEISGDPNNNKPYWDDFQLIAKSIRRTLQGRRKIITTGTYQTNNNNPNVPVLGHVINGEKYGVDVDMWGVDIYSPNPDEPNLRKDIFTYTKKPLFLPEYGTHFQPPVDPVQRSNELLGMVKGLEKYSYSKHTHGNQGPDYDPNGPVYSGGMIFEWVDEYWKAPDDGGCKPNPASAQAYYGSNAVQMKPGCPCVTPDRRSAACQLDQLIPRPILLPNYLPTVWDDYEPEILK